MKVKCIYNNGFKSSLTIGKEYEVISTIDKCYIIIDNKGNNFEYSKTRFQIVEEETFEVGEMIYCDDYGIEVALKSKKELEYRGKVDNKFVCKHKKQGYSVRNYIAKIPKEKTKRELPEMTDEQYEEVLNILKLK